MNEIQLIESVLLPKREPDLSFVHNYKGFGIHKSHCQVEVYFSKQQCFVLFVNGDGTSVTNAAEQLITEIYKEYLSNVFRPDNCIWAETYDRKQIDIIIPNWINPLVGPTGYLKCRSVSWKHLGKII